MCGVRLSSWLNLGSVETPDAKESDSRKAYRTLSRHAASIQPCCSHTTPSGVISSQSPPPPKREYLSLSPRAKDGDDKEGLDELASACAEGRSTLLPCADKARLLFAFAPHLAVARVCDQSTRIPNPLTSAILSNGNNPGANSVGRFCNCARHQGQSIKGCCPTTWLWSDCRTDS